MNYLIANSAKFQSAENEGLCPICGKLMMEVDRMKEGLHFFVWFKCGIGNCEGQWLQKQPAWEVKHTHEMAVNNPQQVLQSMQSLAVLV
jgi:hypothetical protein